MVEIRNCPHHEYFQKLRSELDEGEAEAIALAKIIQADLLLIDESKGRKVALEEGLKIVGVFGVLIDAKKAALINGVKPLMKDLVLKANFRINEKLYQKVLELAEETN